MGGPKNFGFLTSSQLEHVPVIKITYSDYVRQWIDIFKITSVYYVPILYKQSFVLKETCFDSNTLF